MRTPTAKETLEPRVFGRRARAVVLAGLRPATTNRMKRWLTTALGIAFASQTLIGGNPGEPYQEVDDAREGPPVGAPWSLEFADETRILDDYDLIGIAVPAGLIVVWTTHDVLVSSDDGEEFELVLESKEQDSEPPSECTGDLAVHECAGFEFRRSESVVDSAGRVLFFDQHGRLTRRSSRHGRRILAGQIICRR